ncbi:leucine-rich repeat protein, partial [Faecalibacterium sp. Marseille-Q4137]|uniref:leucine-rich repeat protein n=1 Tax=Faecalibacterium sp. Marseille-Q4137 TaxID=2817021 RepID=UPI001A9B793D
MKPKRLISLLVAVCMMITMLPLSAVTAFAADTSSSPDPEEIVGDYKYAYKVNDGNATITEFLGPVDSEGNVDSANNGPYDIDIPSELDHHPVTGLGAYSFSGYASASPYPHNSYQIGRNIRSVDIPQGVTSIGDVAFGCCKFTTLSLGENIETIGGGAFWHCSNLSEITIPENVKEIKNGYSENIYYRKTFEGCSHLKCIILPAGFKSFEASLRDCPTDCVIYYNNDWDHAKDLLADNDNSWYLYNDNGKLKNRNFLYLCKVTFDANGGELNDYDGNLTDHAVVPVYRTEKITETLANELTAIHDPTRAGYKFTGWYTEDGKDSKLFNVKDTAIMEDTTLYAGWEFDPNALDCHPLTVTGGIVTVKNGDKDVTDTLTVTTDETTGKKTYSVPEGATVTVTLDKTLIPEGMVFDIWSTGKFSLPL